MKKNNLKKMKPVVPPLVGRRGVWVGQGVRLGSNNDNPVQSKQAVVIDIVEAGRDDTPSATSIRHVTIVPIAGARLSTPALPHPNGIGC